MKAILLAAGLGSRLRPITDTIPKCLVPIKGRPLLDIWFERLSEAGIDSFLINTHYLAEQVIAYVESRPYRDHVTFIHEPELLGTAGTLSANLGFFEGEDGMLIHADNYCLADFRAFMEVHKNRPPECTMTMMTFRTDSPSSCGIVELDEYGVVNGFHEKVEFPPDNLANGAIYILSNELIERIKNDFLSESDFSTEILYKLLGEIYSYETTEVLVDVGSHRSYKSLNNFHANENQC